jgi:hypothetical protein
MNEGEQVTLRHLPEGAERQASVCSAVGRVLELELGGPLTEFKLGSPAEIKTMETICLGIVERRQEQRIWLNVEHLLDRRILTGIQASWNEADSRGDRPTP